MEQKTEQGEDKIVITSWDYKHGDSRFPTHMVQQVKSLSEAVMNYYHEELEPKDEELYHHDFNVIATSRKFYGAFFEKDLQHNDNQ